MRETGTEFRRNRRGIAGRYRGLGLRGAGYAYVRARGPLWGVFRWQTDSGGSCEEESGTGTRPRAWIRRGRDEKPGGGPGTRFCVPVALFFGGLEMNGRRTV